MKKAKKRVIGPKKGQYRVVKPKKVVAPKVNLLFPGQPHYEGPQRGYFAFVHHAQLFECADCDINDRIDYVKHHKPNSEIHARLRHILYLGEKLNKRIAECERKQYRSSRYDTGIKRAVLAYAKKHIKKFQWNGCTLAHPNGRHFTG